MLDGPGEPPDTTLFEILLTNDDGIDAPGLRALHDSVCAAMESCRPNQPFRVSVVAPDRCRSECGHSIETSRHLSVREHADRWHSVDGTPVDCVRVALYALNVRPHVVLSGINAGANLGVNLMVSGTFAAAREASLLGIPALAASHYRRAEVAKTWDHTPKWLGPTLDEFFAVAAMWRGTLAGTPGWRHDAPLWNVNLPAVEPASVDVPRRVLCEVDRCPIDRTGKVESGGRIRFDLNFHARPREKGRDVDHCFSGKITVSKLHPHLGHLPAADD